MSIFRLRLKRWVFLSGCFASGALSAADMEGRLDLVGGYLSDDAYRFGNYAGVNGQGVATFVNLELQSVSEPGSDEPGYWQVQADRIGLATGRVQLEAGQRGRQRLRLHYREIPRYRFDDAATPFRDPGASQLRLPADWQANDATTAGLTVLEESLEPVKLWSRRHSLTFEYRRYLNEQWTLNADFRRERVEGLRVLGGITGSTGGNARSALLPAPTQYDTQIAELSVAYADARLIWSAFYQASFFQNDRPALSWPTPYARHPQWAVGTGFPDGINQLALEPDNQSHQLRLNASLILAGSGRLHMDALVGRQFQDDSLLPYSLNPQLEAEALLPNNSINARVNNTRFNLRFTSRPAARLNLVTRLNYRDRDNQTAVRAWQAVRGDAVQQLDAANARLNRPYSLTEIKASAEAAYRMSGGLRLEGDYHYSQTKRNYSEISRADEQGIGLGLRSTRFSSLALALSYQYQWRRTDDYVGNRPLIATHVPGSLDEGDFENHPLLRKYYLSERDRNQWRLRGDWYPASRLTVGAALAYNQDDYPSGFFGLNSSDMFSATLDVAYSLGDDLRLSAFINRDRYRSLQSGRSFRGSVPAEAFDPERDWTIAATDYFDTAGISLERDRLRPRIGGWQALGDLNLSLRLSHSRSRGEIDASVASGLQSAPVADLSTRLNTAALSALYRWPAGSSLRLAVEHERYSSSDFALDGVRADTLNNLILMGQGSPNYEVTWVTLGYRIEF